MQKFCIRHQGIAIDEGGKQNVKVIVIIDMSTENLDGISENKNLKIKKQTIGLNCLSWRAYYLIFAFHFHLKSHK